MAFCVWPADRRANHVGNDNAYRNQPVHICLRRSREPRYRSRDSTAELINSRKVATCCHQENLVTTPYLHTHEFDSFDNLVVVHVVVWI